MKFDTRSTELNGIRWYVPDRSRRPTERMVSFSTTPVVPPAVTTSPSFIAFSNWMKAPVMMSCTSFWAPKPMASPSTPAPASSGPMFTPISDRISMAARMASVIMKALRSNARSVRSRAVGTLPTDGLSRYSMNEDMASQAKNASRLMSSTERSRLLSVRPASVARKPMKSMTCQIWAMAMSTATAITMRTTWSIIGTKAFSRTSSRGTVLRTSSGRRIPPADHALDQCYDHYAEDHGDDRIGPWPAA